MASVALRSTTPTLSHSQSGLRTSARNLPNTVDLDSIDTIEALEDHHQLLCLLVLLKRLPNIILALQPVGFRT